MTIAFRPLRNPNPLGFPGGVLPGFDPSHPAARNCFLSAVAANGSFISNLNGAPGSVVAGGTPALPVQAVLAPPGPAVGFSLANSATKTSYISLPLSPPNSRVVTFAAVVTPVFSGAISAQAVACTNLTGGGGAAGLDLRLGLSGSTQTLQIHVPGVGAFTASSFGMLTARSYFVFASGNSLTGAANYVMLDLATGALQSGTTSTGAFTPAAPAGGVVVGNYPNGGTPANEFMGYISAVHGANQFMSLQQGVQWAADPWSFWYPRCDTVLVGVTSGGGFFARPYYDLGARSANV